MKKSFHFIVAFVILSSIVIFSCNKKDQSFIPSVTATINGQSWSYGSCTKCFSEFPDLTATIDDGYFDLRAVRMQYQSDSFLDFELSNFSGVGQYYLLGKNGTSPGGYGGFVPDTGGTTTYRTDSTKFGVVNITRMDTENKRLYGNFKFDVYNPQDSTKVIHITSGSFAVSYINEN